MGSLRMCSSITPTLTGVMLATALGTASFNTHANANALYAPDIYKASKIDLSETSKTFSSLDITKKSEVLEIDSLLIQAFEKISKNSKPLDEDFAKILSDNILDLF